MDKSKLLSYTLLHFANGGGLNVEFCFTRENRHTQKYLKSISLYSRNVLDHCERERQRERAHARESAHASERASARKSESESERDRERERESARACMSERERERSISDFPERV